MPEAALQAKQFHGSHTGDFIATATKEMMNLLQRVECVSFHMIIQKTCKLQTYIMGGILVSTDAQCGIDIKCYQTIIAQRESL